MKIKKTILTKIRESIRIKGLLCVALNKSMKAIENYCDRNDQLLTTVAALKVIREELNLTDEQIFTEEKVHA